MKRLENHSEYVTEAKEAYAYSSVKKKKKIQDGSISEPEASQNN